MDRNSQYRDTIRCVLTNAAALFPQNPDIRTESIFDDQEGHYQVGQVGWIGKKRIDQVYLHVDLIDGKVWVQYDGTELCIAEALFKAGIPREHIVLGFKHPSRRPDTDYAAA